MDASATAAYFAATGIAKCILTQRKISWRMEKWWGLVNWLTHIICNRLTGSWYDGRTNQCSIKRTWRENFCFSSQFHFRRLLLPSFAFNNFFHQLALTIAMHPLPGFIDTIPFKSGPVDQIIEVIKALVKGLCQYRQQQNCGKRLLIYFYCSQGFAKLMVSTELKPGILEKLSGWN